MGLGRLVPSQLGLSSPHFPYLARPRRPTVARPGATEQAARAFDEKAESLIVDSHDGANRIQDPHWCKGGQ